MNGTNVKLFSVIAVAAMVLCAFIPMMGGNSFGNDQDVSSQSLTSDVKPEFRYVSFGDSMTAGFGMGYDGMSADYIGYYTPEGGVLKNTRGFLKEVTGTYPARITEYLSSDYDVTHVQLGISGARSIDMRSIMYGDDFTGSDSFPGDDYTKSLFVKKASFNDLYLSAIAAYNDLAAERGIASVTEFDEDSRLEAFGLLGDIYEQEIANADLITYNSHFDFGRALAEIYSLVAGSSDVIEIDYSLYVDDCYLEKADKIEKFVNKYLASAIILAFPELDKSEIAKYLQMIDDASKIITYAVVSYCSDYDAIMTYINEVNTKNANVIIIDTYDQLNELSLNVFGVEISLTKLYDYLIGIAVDYTKYLSKCNCVCDNITLSHVTVDEDVELLCDEFKSGEADDISDISKASLMYAIDADKFGPTSVSNYKSTIGTYDYIDTANNYCMTKFMHAIFSAECLDVGTIMSSGIAGLTVKMSGAIELLSNPLKTCTGEFGSDGSFTISAVGESYTFNSTELCILNVELALIKANSLLGHLNATGHETVFDSVLDVIIDRCILLA